MICQALAFAVLTLLTDVPSSEQSADAASPSADGAAATSGRGFTFGVRSGYGLPFGSLRHYPEGGADVSEYVNGTIPIWLDLGYRLNSNTDFGGFFQYAVGLPPPYACQDYRQCEQHVIHLGWQLHYHFRPRAFLSPWAGLGMGFEFLSYSRGSAIGGNVYSAGDRYGETYGGLELLNLQTGLDLRVNRHFSLGPFIGFSSAVFLWSHASWIDVGIPGSTSETGGNPSLHHWLMIGVRGEFGINAI